MVARPGTYHANFNGGELSKELHGRVDIKQYYSGAAEMTNVEPVPQGGFRLLPRSRLLSRVRRELEDIAASGTTDNSGNFSATGTLYQVDFAQAESLAAVLIEGFFSADLDDALEGALQVQYNDGAAWQDFGPVCRLTPASRNIMRARPPDDPVTAEGVRVELVVTPASTIAITAGGVTARTELTGYTQVQATPFTFSLDQVYEIVMSLGHMDIWRAGVWTAAAALDPALAQVGEIVPEQRFDTLLLFHEKMVPRRVLRDASDDEWPWDDVPWTQVPQVDYGADYVNTDDEWIVYIRYPSGTASGNERIVAVTVDGEETAGVQVDTSGGATAGWNAFAVDLKAAIEALAGVQAGVAVTRQSDSATAAQIVVVFSGGGNEGAHTFAAQVVSHTDSAATVGHTVIGKKGGEDLFSTTRGWPACARFYQDRLVTGGFLAKQGALLASATGDYFNGNIESALASAAILLNIDTDGAERLQRMNRSSHLVLFTSDAEYYISDRTLSSTAVLNIVECSRNGSATGVPIVSNEGELLYVSRNRSVVYAASYNDISQKYESEPMSLVASHLVDGIAGAAIQRAEVETDAARYWAVRQDGAMAVAILIRQQEISAFVRWTTDGDVKSIMTNGANDALAVIERQVAGQPVRFLERLEAGLVFDCVTELTLDPPGTTVTGLEDYEGAEIWAVADSRVAGPFTVAGGEIELPFQSEEVAVGRWSAPVVRPLPIPRLVQERVMVERPIRVHTVRAFLIGTTSIAIGANDDPVHDVPLLRAGDPADEPPPPFDGPIDETGLTGWTETGAVVLTQIRPGSLQVRNFTVEAKI